MDVDMHKAARALVSKCGFAVFPLHGMKSDGSCTCGQDCTSPMKHPHGRLAPRGVLDATTDPDQVDQWWAMGNYNIGIACGQISGITVVDVDADKGGILSWNNLIKRNGPIDDTWQVQTGGGGYHIFFRHIPGITNKVRAAAGIDIRNDGGYIVSPPSIHQSGNRYEWMDGMKPSASMQYPADAPEWLVKFLGADTNERRAATPVVGTISEGGRNHVLASLAGSMRARGMEEDEILAALTVVNNNRCNPPLEYKEVSTIAWSIARYPPATAIAQSMAFGGKNG